jgi:hypothetical protein
VSFPRTGTTNRWDNALVKISVSGQATTIVETTSASDFADYYIGQAEFEGNDVMVVLSGAVNGRWDQSIYRDSGAGLERFIAGPYLTTSGSSTYSYLYPGGHSVQNGDFLFNGYPSILVRIDGRIRHVASRGDQLDGVTPSYLNASAWGGNDLLGGKSVAFSGSTQTSSNYISPTEYSYANEGWVFHGKLDTDRDGSPDDLDNCPIRPNPAQTDTDGNGIGDVCEDSDADGLLDPDDNCPVDPNADQLNSDTDPFGDACDVCEFIDDDQADLDGDGEGDACDTDWDGDLVDNTIDNCPLVLNPVTFPRRLIQPYESPG